MFKIDYPNKEVEQSFTKFLLAGYLNQHTAITAMTILDIQKALTQHDIHRMMAIISNMFKLLPVQFFQEPREKTDKQGFKQLIYTDVGETFYHAIIFLIFKILGIQMHAEVSAQDGRIDAMVETDNYVYLFEFKKDRSPKAALNQIKKQAYEKLFALSKKQIFSIGVGFSAKAKGISNYAIDPEIA